MLEEVFTWEQSFTAVIFVTPAGNAVCQKNGSPKAAVWACCAMSDLSYSGSSLALLSPDCSLPMPSSY